MVAQVAEELEGLSLLELRQRLDDALQRGQDRKTALWRAYRRRMLRERMIVLTRAEFDPKVREQAIAEAERSVLFFARTFVNLIEPKNASNELPTTIPFVPYPLQERVMLEMVRVLTEGGTIFIEKGRQEGVTWAVLAVVAWLFRFRPNIQIGLGSRTEGSVDVNPGGRNPDTLFGRVEFIMENLPDWLKPAGYSLTDKTVRQKLQWSNPENGAFLSGEAASTHFGTQRTKTLWVIDEITKWENQQAVLTNTRPNCRARVIFGTPEPDAAAVIELIGRLKDENPRNVLSFDWLDHPERDSDWERRERIDLGDEQFEKEHGLSWQGSAERVIYPEWAKVPQQAVPFDPRLPLYGSIDFGRSQGSGLVYYQIDPDTGQVRILQSFFRAGEAIDWFLPFFGKPIKSGIHDYAAYDIEVIERVQAWSRAAGGVIWFGDPAGRQTTAHSDQSVIDILRTHGIHVTTKPSIINHDERQSRTRRMLRNCVCHNVYAKSLNDSMRNYRRPARREGVTYQKKALHNRWSHLATALEYAAVNLPEVVATRQERPLRRHVAAYERIR